MAKGRADIVKKYGTIIGRNKYSQPRRAYVYSKYKDGKYYSDCSSSIAATFKAMGHPIRYGGSTLPNTVGMYHSTDLVDVPVKIKNGVIQNPEVLQTCDVLLFAGTDKSRSGAGYVGHVEMVGEITARSETQRVSESAKADRDGRIENSSAAPVGKVWLYGHGSGNPKRHEMNAYCKQRYGSKTSTKVGNKGLIKVRRHVDFADADGWVDTHLGERELKKGCTGLDVRALQAALIAHGFDVGPDGADGDFGANTEKAVKAYQAAANLPVTGVADKATISSIGGALQIPDLNRPGRPTGRLEIPSGDFNLGAQAATGGNTSATDGPALEVIGESVNLRSGPGAEYSILKVVHKGERLVQVNASPAGATEGGPKGPTSAEDAQGAPQARSCGPANAGTEPTGWMPLVRLRRACWASAKYAVREGDRIKITGGTVNIRSGPGEEYRVVDTVNKGATFAPVDAADWRPVKVGKTVLWIKADYVREV